ncbi:hypothetical protein SAMN05518672_101327 [Chitinophaga sp. CF118]|nr:hypothetical protein SAMN05518672_101327 [Chitinophaga sp. CF118]
MSLDITEQRLELFQSLFKGRQDAMQLEKKRRQHGLHQVAV